MERKFCSLYGGEDESLAVFFPVQKASSVKEKVDSEGLNLYFSCIFFILNSNVSTGYSIKSETFQLLFQHQ